MKNFNIANNKIKDLQDILNDIHLSVLEKIINSLNKKKLDNNISNNPELLLGFINDINKIIEKFGHS